MQPFTLFEHTLATRFGGVISSGKHEPDGRACLLEAAHAALGEAWSDRPDRWPDFRPLNDARWSSDHARTTALVPVLRAYWDWNHWPLERQRKVIDRAVILIVQRIVGNLRGLPSSVRKRCRACATLSDADKAAKAAWEARAAFAAVVAEETDAAKVAEWAAKVAEWAAWASMWEAARAARAESAEAADRVLRLVCACFIEAVQP